VNVADALLLLSHENEAERDRALLALAADKRAAVHAIVAALKRTWPTPHFTRMVLLLAAFEARDAVGALVDLLERGTLGFDERAVVARAIGELVDDRHRGDARLRRHALLLARDLLAPTRASVVPVLAVVADNDSVDMLRMLAVTDADAEVRRLAGEALPRANARLLTVTASSTATTTASTTATTTASTTATTTASTTTASTTATTARRPAAEAALPPGAEAIDFAALVASSSSTPSSLAATSSAGAAGVPEGGVAVDFEALVKAQQLAPPTTAALTPDEQRIARLRDPRWTERARAVDEVVARGRDIVPALLAHLGHDAPARLGICLALGRLQAPEAASALLLVATSEPRTAEERDVQAVALKALANCLTGTEQGVSAPLIPLLKSPDPFVRAGAVLCLGRLAERVGARAATLLLANDRHDEVKKAAAVALSEAVREEDTDLVPAWLGTLDGVPRPPVEGQEALLVALARVDLADGPANAPWRVRTRHRMRRLVFGTTSSLRRQAITILDRCYAEDDPPPAWVVEDVLTRLQDASADVRLVAASFVARFLEPGFGQAVPRLEDALERNERGVSLLCLEALRRHDTPLARAALDAAAASDPDPEVRSRAAALAADFVPKSVEWSPAMTTPLATLTTSPSPNAMTNVTPNATPNASPHATSAGATAPPSPSAATPRRVRPASGSSGDVVEARDAPSSKT
jgi:hypothetical protein